MSDSVLFDRTGPVPSYILNGLAGLNSEAQHAMPVVRREQAFTGHRGGDVFVRSTYHPIEIWDASRDLLKLVIPGTTSQASQAASDCYKNISKANAFFLNAFGRDIFGEEHGQGRARTKTAVIFYPHAEKNTLMWVPQKQAICIADVQTGVVHPLTNNPDMITHELAHGMIQYCSRLGYAPGQSRALNESLADTYAIMFKHERNRTHANAPDANWLFSDDFLINPVEPFALRSFSNPGRAHRGRPLLLGNLFLIDCQVNHVKRPLHIRMSQ